MPSLSRPTSTECAGYRLNGCLRHLAMAAALTAAPTAQSPASTLAETGETLRSLTQRVVTASGDKRAQATDAVQAQIDETVAMIDRMTVSSCMEPGQVYLNGSNGQLLSSVWLHIGGAIGGQWFSFVSATNLSDVITAINTMTDAIGVHARMAEANPERIELASINLGANQFVRVRQLTGQQPIVFAQAQGGQGLFEWMDHGCVVGVPVCADPAEIYMSTGYHLELQGYRSVLLTVRGNFGTQQFTFASGTEQPNLVNAVNTFETRTGVTAAVSLENPDRVRFSSLAEGSEALVRVSYRGYPNNLLSDNPFGAVSSTNLKDRGRDALLGDANCDYHVNGADLTLVLQAWGECPASPVQCVGDLDQNGVVDIDDLVRVISNWGTNGR